MPNTTYRQVHTDRALTNLSIAHYQTVDTLVTHRFFPIVSVSNASDEYDFYPAGYFHRLHDTSRAEEGIANTIGWTKSKRSYMCHEHALRTFISDKKRANADNPAMLDMQGAHLVSFSLMLEREVSFVKTFLTPGVWSTERKGVTGTPTSGQILKWSDAASDPVRDIDMLKKDFVLKGFRVPNKALLTYDVYLELKNHPDILERIKYSGSNTDPAKISLRAIAALFELDEILIMQTVINQGVEGVEDQNGNPVTLNAYLKEGTMLLGHVPPGAGLMSPSAGITFSWNKWKGIGANGAPLMRRYRESPAKQGEYIEAEYSIDQRVTAPDLGGLLTELI